MAAPAPATAPATLARLGFRDPDGVTPALRALGAWPPDGAAASSDLLRALAGSAAPDLAARTLAAIAGASADQGRFAATLRAEPELRRNLVAVTAASASLGRWLVTNPTETGRLADERALAASRSRADLVAEAVATVGRHRDQAAAWDALRRFKRRELLRIAVRDLRAEPAEPPAGLAGVQEVGKELAALAEACLEAGLQVAARSLGPQPEVRLAVLGMGKLGGAELNYVSDIDVLFCHAPVAGGSEQAATAAAVRLARELLGGLSAVTPEGSCFRVDANLRPEGRHGPLSRTLGAYAAYWDRWAEPWELQALIKVRPVAGDAGLAATFCAEAATRTYPERLDPEAVAAVRRMKARVEAERLPAGTDPKLHLKLGPGGLADVEWTAQLLQLLHGGYEPALRAQGTLTALERLVAAGHLEAGEAGWLADAYALCVRLRNAAYLVSGRPVESLPTDPRALERLARAVGEPPPGRQRLLERHRRATRRARRVVDRRFWEASA